MELALQFNGPVNGIKGPSPLINLTRFNLVWGYGADYMHSVLLRVTRKFTDYMFNSVYSRESYYIGKLWLNLISLCLPYPKLYSSCVRLYTPYHVFDIWFVSALLMLHMATE